MREAQGVNSRQVDDWQPTQDEHQHQHQEDPCDFALDRDAPRLRASAGRQVSLPRQRALVFAKRIEDPAVRHEDEDVRHQDERA